jgi:hypothetical protein
MKNIDINLIDLVSLEENAITAYHEFENSPDFSVDTAKLYTRKAVECARKKLAENNLDPLPISVDKFLEKCLYGVVDWTYDESREWFKQCNIPDTLENQDIFYEIQEAVNHIHSAFRYREFIGDIEKEFGAEVANRIRNSKVTA